MIVWCLPLSASSWNVRQSTCRQDVARRSSRVNSGRRSRYLSMEHLEVLERNGDEVGSPELPSLHFIEPLPILLGCQFTIGVPFGEYLLATVTGVTRCRSGGYRSRPGPAESFEFLSIVSDSGPSRQGPTSLPSRPQFKDQQRCAIVGPLRRNVVVPDRRSPHNQWSRTRPRRRCGLAVQPRLR